MVDRHYLLTSRQMATFVAAGFLRFDALVPDELNHAAMRELEQGLQRAPAGTPLAYRSVSWPCSVSWRVQMPPARWWMGWRPLYR